MSVKYFFPRKKYLFFSEKVEGKTASVLPPKVSLFLLFFFSKKRQKYRKFRESKRLFKVCFLGASAFFRSRDATTTEGKTGEGGGEGRVARFF